MADSLTDRTSKDIGIVNGTPQYEALSGFVK